MKYFVLATALAASLAAPVFADGHAANFAVMHFNMDEDSSMNRRMTPTAMQTVTLTPGSTLANVFEHLNMDADSSMDVNGDAGVTIIMSDPAFAGEIFRRLMIESQEDE